MTGRWGWSHDRLRSDPGAALAAAYVAAVSALAVTHLVTGTPDPDALASSPTGIAAGQLWELVTSAFVVAGSPALQLIALAAVTWGLVLTTGSGTFWRAAVAGHVGATALAYGAIAIAGTATLGLLPRVVDLPDYGISCVWAATGGALAARAVRRPDSTSPLPTAIGATSALAVLVTLPFASSLAGLEHVLALVLGALVGARSRASP